MTENDFNSRTLDVKKSPDDARDRKLISAPNLATDPADLPVTHTLSCTVPIWDQRDSGSCAAHTTAAAFAMILGDITFDPSRLFIYSQAKYLDNRNYDNDDGLYLRDACGVLRLMGTCKNETWPFRVDLFSQKPSEAALEEADKVSGKIYYYLANPTLQILKYILYDLRSPVIIACDIYANFVPDSNGYIPMPSGKLQGGHSLLIIGYDDKKSCFLARNSWGSRWGIDGNCWLPYNYVTDTSITFEHRFFKPTEGSNTSGGKTQPILQRPTFHLRVLTIIVILSFICVLIFLAFKYSSLFYPSHTK